MYKDDGRAVLLDPTPAYTPQRIAGTTVPGGQDFIMYKPNVADPGLPAVVLCHQAQNTTGATSGGHTFGDAVWIAAFARYMASQGFCVICSDCHGDQWGSDLGNAGIDDALAWLDLVTNADVNNIFMKGYSMGGCQIVNYIVHGLGSRTCIAAELQNPVIDLAYMHDNTWSGTIDAAYGSHANYVAALPTRDPRTLAAAGLLDAVPLLVSYGSNDTTVAPAGNAYTIEFVGNCALGVLGPDDLIHFGAGLQYGPGVGSWMMSHIRAIATTRKVLK